MLHAWMAEDAATMRLLLLRITPLLLSLLLSATGCAASRSVAPTEPVAAISPPSLEALAENVWVHKSWAQVEPWGLVLSQGLVVKGPEGVTLVDTAWNDADTERLLALIEETLGAPVDTVIVTHAHADKLGGLGAVHRQLQRTLALPITNEDAVSRGLVPARDTFGEDEAIGSLQVFHPGPGHTRDNVVVFHPASGTLFGGCLIRPGDSNSLGNTADADLARWADSVAAASKRFPDAKVVIPSHGAAGGRELLDHTIELARAASNR